VEREVLKGLSWEGKIGGIPTKIIIELPPQELIIKLG